MITTNELRSYLIDKHISEGLISWTRSRLFPLRNVMMELDRDLKLRLLGCRTRRKLLKTKNLRKGYIKKLPIPDYLMQQTY